MTISFFDFDIFGEPFKMPRQWTLKFLELI